MATTLPMLMSGVIPHSHPWIERPNLHEVRINPLYFESLRIKPYATLFLKSDHGEVSCRAIPEINVCNENIHINHHCHRALNNGFSLHNDNYDEYSSINLTIEVHDNEKTTSNEIEKVVLVECVQSSSLLTPWSKNYTSLLKSKKSLCSAVSRICRGLPLKKGCLICGDILGSDILYRVQNIQHFSTAISIDGDGDKNYIGYVSNRTVFEIIVESGKNDDEFAYGASSQISVASEPLLSTLDEVLDMINLATINLRTDNNASDKDNGGNISRNSLLPRGALLYGSSGVGKSTLVHVLVDKLIESNMKVMSLSGYDIILHSEPQELFRKVLTQVIKHRTSDKFVLVVIDDLQAVTSTSGNDDDDEAGGGAQERVAVAHLKSFLDDLAEIPSVFALGVCTSDKLGKHSSLLRTGRFERKVQMTAPTMPDREALLRNMLSHICSSPERIKELATATAKVTPGFVASDLVKLVDAAVLHAMNRIPNTVDTADVELHHSINWGDISVALLEVHPSELRDLDVKRFNISEVSWETSVGGYESLKERINAVITGPWHSNQSNLYQSLHVPPISGALLHGPSGNGKTLIASVIASETKCNFVHVKSNDILSKWLGESEKILRSLFKRARASAPCILFFDDFDVLVGKRGLVEGKTESTGLESRLLITLLNEMDGISGNAGQVLVLAATLSPDSIDAALLRPGRLQESLYIGPPGTCEDRLEILKIHTKNMPFESKEEVNKILEKLAALTSGFTCSELAELCRSTGQSALRNYIADKAVRDREELSEVTNSLPPISEQDWELQLKAFHTDKGMAIPTLSGVPSGEKGLSPPAFNFLSKGPFVFT